MHLGLGAFRPPKALDVSSERQCGLKASHRHLINPWVRPVRPYFRAVREKRQFDLDEGAMAKTADSLVYHDEHLRWQPRHLIDSGIFRCPAWPGGIFLRSI